MIPASFSYHKANSVQEALGMLQQHGGDAKLLAGGHSLIPAMKLRLNQPSTLIDIRHIAELQTISVAGDHVVIGAGVTHHQIATNAHIHAHAPILAEAAEWIGDVQVRNMGTLGGSLAHADPAADWPAVMIASHASIEMQSASGSRTVGADDFFLGFFETALQEDEIITAIKIPVTGAHTGSAYKKFMQPASRYAIVGCAVVLTHENGKCTAASIGMTGVSEFAYREKAIEDALVGKELTPENIKHAASLAAKDVTLMSDHFASEPYRKHLASVYAERALVAAAGL
jgi:carbon-monoxide dehydrogenase medium subunit